jgi:hypothetical protein
MLRLYFSTAPVWGIVDTGPWRCDTPPVSHSDESTPRKAMTPSEKRISHDFSLKRVWKRSDPLASRGHNGLRIAFVLSAACEIWSERTRLTIGPLIVQTARYDVLVGGVERRLQRREFAVLETQARNAALYSLADNSQMWCGPSISLSNGGDA